MAAPIELLKRVPLFQGLDDKNLKRLADTVGFMSDDDRRGLWRNHRGRVQHVLDHRTARDTMQHFRTRRFHPRAFTRGENDDVEVHRPQLSR